MTTTATDKLVTKEISLPAEPKRKMRAHAAAAGSSLAADVAAIVTRYADRGYQGADGEINIANVDDPGPQLSDGRVKFSIPESVWEQARIRTIMDETTIASVLRRAAIALNL